ncbi:unnamed protein product [Echinostoma caproni]|uniref:Uncharacterized protein n=1 Tax=Echinostoma caproni TaxID=27848 RepID=A0A3P8L9B1_9TREM|nr:unnamed protein product [Echinostoma caproni]
MLLFHQYTLAAYLSVSYPANEWTVSNLARRLQNSLSIKGSMNRLSKYLIEFPEVCHWQNSAGEYIAHLACQYGRSEVVMLLGRLDYNFNVEYNACGYLPIHIACYHKNVDCVLALHLCGADINATTESDLWTPLHIACQIGYLPLIHVLLRIGARTGVRNVFNQTPQDLARAMENEQVVTQNSGKQMNLYRNVASISLSFNVWPPCIDFLLWGSSYYSYMPFKFHLCETKPSYLLVFIVFVIHSISFMFITVNFNVFLCTIVP